MKRPHSLFFWRYSRILWDIEYLKKNVNHPSIFYYKWQWKNVQLFFCVEGPGRGLPGSPVEDPAEPISTSRTSTGCLWVPGKFPGPGQVCPCAVSSFYWSKHKSSWPHLTCHCSYPVFRLSYPLLQHRTGLPGPLALLDPSVHWQPGQQWQRGLLWRRPARAFLQRLPGRLLHSCFQTQSYARGEHEERYKSPSV